MSETLQWPAAPASIDRDSQAHSLPATYSSLVDEHGSDLCSLAYLIVLDHGKAEAIVSEVLLDLASGKPATRDIHSHRQISRRLYLRCVNSESLPHTQHDDSHHGDSQHSANQLLATRAATAAEIAKLSVHERSAIALCRHGDCTYLEVAALMCLPVPVVLGLLRSGLQALSQ